MKKTYPVAQLLLTTMFHSMAIGATCPPPPSSIAPSIDVTTTFDKKTGLYTYRYGVRNGSAAKIPLDYFGFLIDASPRSSKSPAYWDGKYIEIPGKAPKFSWGTIAVAPGTENVVTGDGSLGRPIYAIAPGKSLSGFEIVSDRKPGLVQFYSQGFTQPLKASPGEDEPPECEGWDMDNPLLLTQVSGVVVGPSSSNIISVKIRARDGGGKYKPKDLDKLSQEEKITLYVLGDDNFNPADVDIATVTFGPGKAKPIFSKMISNTGFQSFSDDEEPWEKTIKSHSSGTIKDDSKKVDILMLVFKISDIDAQCNLDKSLILRGETKLKNKFIGAISAKYSGCDKLKKHKQH